DTAGDWLPGHGERPVFCGDQRHLRDADGRRARDRARRFGRHADPRRVLLPDPRAIRQPRLEAPGKAQGRGRRVIEILFVLGCPLAGALVLATMGQRNEAATISVAACFATFLAAAALTVRVISEGRLLVLDRV